MLHTLNSSLLGKKPHSVLRHTEMQITSEFYVMEWETKGKKKQPQPKPSQEEEKGMA